MVLPTPVKILDYYTTEAGEQSLDVFVSDEELYNHNADKFDGINLSVVRASLAAILVSNKRLLDS